MNEPMAVSGTRRAMKEMVDGTLRVQVDIDPSDRKLFFDNFNEIDTRVCLVRLKSESQIQDETTETGRMAQALYKNGFFINPIVNSVLGSDADFLDWIRSHTVSATGKNEKPDDPIVPAHVRRVQYGSGTGIKPEYSAIPLLNSEHNLQHQKGESAVASREQFEKWRNSYLTKWSKLKVYEVFGIDSLKELNKQEFCNWASKNGLMRFIPTAWRTKWTY